MKWFLFLSGALAFFVPQIYGQDLQEIWQSAQSSSPDLQADRLHESIAADQLHQANLNLGPQLSFSAGSQVKRLEDAPLGSNRNFTSSGASVRLEQNILNLDRWATKSQRVVGQNLSREESFNNRNQLRRSLTEAYLNLVLDQLQIKRLDEVFINMSQTRENILALEKAAQIDQVTSNFLLSRLTALSINRRSIEDNKERSQLFVERSTTKPVTMICEREIPLPPPPTSEGEVKHDQLSDVKIRDFEVRIADQAVQATRYAYLPSLQIFADKSWQKNDNLSDGQVAAQSRNFQLGLQLNWSLTDSLSRASEVGEALKIRELKTLNARSYKDQKKRTIESLKQRLDRLFSRALENRELQVNTERMMEGLKIKAEKGLEDRVNFISNMIAASEILLSALREQYAYSIAYVDYMHEIGRYDDQELSTLSQKMCHGFHNPRS